MGDTGKKRITTNKKQPSKEDTRSAEDSIAYDEALQIIGEEVTLKRKQE